MYVTGIKILSYLVTGRKTGYYLDFARLSQAKERLNDPLFFLFSFYLQHVKK